MPVMIPAGRMQLEEQASKQYAAMYRLERSIELQEPLRDLVKVRASQMNGCAFCIDMHWKHARANGETEERLYSLPVAELRLVAIGIARSGDVRPSKRL